MIRTGLVASATALTIVLGAWMWLYSVLPPGAEQVPVHWGLKGSPDRFASRDEAIALFGLLPAAWLLATLLFSAIASIEPLRTNAMKARRVFLTGWIGAQALLALVACGVALMTAASASGAASDSNLFVRVVVAGGGVLVAFIGDALPKTRPNIVAGMRMHWTLTSDLAWEKTHRLAGWLFVLFGLWLVAAAFTLDMLTLAFAAAAPLIAIALTVCVHAYVVWRHDPDRRRSASGA
jgi:uncharacterized membrane protein